MTNGKALPLRKLPKIVWQLTGTWYFCAVEQDGDHRDLPA
jgi:hypothetical protein